MNLTELENKTKIISLSTGAKNIELTGEISQIGNIRDVSTRYGPSKVVDATIEDETGQITLVVWGDLTEKIRQGNKIKVTKSYVSEWNGKLQLNVGRFGKLLILN